MAGTRLLSCRSPPVARPRHARTSLSVPLPRRPAPRRRRARPKGRPATRLGLRPSGSGCSARHRFGLARGDGRLRRVGLGAALLGLRLVGHHGGQRRTGSGASSTSATAAGSGTGTELCLTRGSRHRSGSRPGPRSRAERRARRRGARLRTGPGSGTRPLTRGTARARAHAPAPRTGSGSSATATGDAAAAPARAGPRSGPGAAGGLSAHALRGLRRSRSRPRRSRPGRGRLRPAAARHPAGRGRASRRLRARPLERLLDLGAGGVRELGRLVARLLEQAVALAPRPPGARVVASAWPSRAARAPRSGPRSASRRAGARSLRGSARPQPARLHPALAAADLDLGRAELGRRRRLGVALERVGELCGGADQMEGVHADGVPARLDARGPRRPPAARAAAPAAERVPAEALERLADPLGSIRPRGLRQVLEPRQRRSARDDCGWACGCMVVPPCLRSGRGARQRSMPSPSADSVPSLNPGSERRFRARASTRPASASGPR